MGRTLKIVLVMLVFTGLSCYFLNTILLPVYREATDLRNTLNQKRSELKYLEFVNLRKSALVRAEELVNQRAERLIGLINPVLKEENLILEIQSAVQRGGLELSSITLSKSRDAKGGEGVSVSLGLNGSYAALISFLREIETFPHIMTVDNLAVSGQGNELNISMQATIFYGEIR